MVGRAAEHARAVGALDGLEAGGVLTVEGEPGIGKTRLLAELAEQADERRFLVLEGRASESEQSVPFAPFLDALDDYLASVNPRTIKAANAEGLAELARIFPSLAELGDGQAGAAQEERYRSHHAVRLLLEGLAASRPVLLVIDDLHWADAASVELVAHLIRHPPRARVLVAVSFRPAQMPDRLRAEIGGVDRIEVAALGDEDALELVRAIAGDGADEILRHSGGNPFYLEELAREWAATGGLEVSGGGPDALGVPAEVGAAIERELRELDPAAGRLLQGAAVAGDGFDPELASRAGEVEGEVALAALDHLLERDLVRPTDVPRRFRFRHPIVRQAVYASAPAGWRLGAHARVAEVLGERGESAAGRAHHVELSAEPGNRAAIELLTEAGQAASSRAPSAAAHWFGAALRLVPAEDGATRLGLLAPRARALAASGRYHESLSDLDEVLALVPPEAIEIRARVIASSAKVKQILGRHGEAHEQLERTLATLEDAASPEATTLKLELAADSFFVGDQLGFESWVRAALEDARGRGDRGLIAAATGLHSAALYMRDNLDAARPELERGLKLIAELDEAELGAHLNAHTWTALGAVCMEHFDDAVALLDRTIDSALAAGQGHMPTLMRTTQAFAYISQGRLEGAATRLEAAVDAAILTRNPAFLAWARGLQCWAMLIGGNLPEAVRLGELAVEGAAPDDPLTATSACYLAEARLAAGGAEEAREQVLSMTGGPGLPLIERGIRSRGYELLTRAELDADRIEAAAEWARLAAEAADGLGIDGRTADALRARAAVALARGDHDDAGASALASGKAAERAGLRIDVERARTLVGRALAGGGDADDARNELERARDELTTLGARHYADEAAGHLRRLGVRVPRAERSETADHDDGLGELSSREREIAQLVAAGRRNQEIAEALFLSVRTVEGHLGRVYRKLEVSSRTQLTALVSAASENGTGA
jgi:DNA-binding CsgD family transcriptional regulator